MKRKSIIFMIALALTLVLSVAALSACDDNKDDPPVTYTVNVNGGTGGGEYTAGATVKITANAPATGKVFTSWTLDGVAVDNASAPELTFTMPANAVTATANYGDKAYLFALENCTADKETAKFGEQVTFTADEVIGKRFDSWNIKGVDDLTGLDLTKSPLTITMPANDINVAAVLEDIDYTVTVTDGTADKATAHYGDTVKITADTAPTGQTFDRWEITGIDTASLDLTQAELTFTVGTANIVAKATYKYIYYTVTVNGGTAYTDGESAGSITAEYGDFINIVAEVPTGQRFVRWTSDSDEVVFDSETSATTTFEMPAKNVTVTAVFEYIYYTVTVNGGTAYTDGESAGSITAEYGDFINIVAEVPTGQRFVRWTSDSDEVVFDSETSATTTFEMPAKNVTVTAVFEYIDYTVTVNGGTAQVNDGVASASVKAHYGEEVTITAKVPVGKEFVRWSFDELAPDGLTLTDAELTFTMPAGNVTATAVFEDINYEVKVICDNTETKTAHYGEEVTITAKNIEGKIFVCWAFTNLDTEGLDLTRAELSFTMPANNVTAKAIYEELITLTFEGTTAQSEELQYKDNASKSFRLPLGSGQDSCTYTIELSNPAFTFKVYGSDGEVYIDDNGEGVKSITIDREDNYTIEVINTGTAANCTLTVTKV